MTKDQAVAMVRGYLSRLDTKKWQVSPQGSSFRLIQESTAVYVDFIQENGELVVHLKAPVLEAVSEQAPVHALAVLNGSVRFGRFCFYPAEELVSLEHELLADTLDEPEFLNALIHVALTADEWDEKLRDELEFGGHVHIQQGAGPNP